MMPIIIVVLNMFAILNLMDVLYVLAGRNLYRTKANYLTHEVGESHAKIMDASCRGEGIQPIAHTRKPGDAQAVTPGHTRLYYTHDGRAALIRAYAGRMTLPNGVPGHHT